MCSSLITIEIQRQDIVNPMIANLHKWIDVDFSIIIYDHNINIITYNLKIYILSDMSQTPSCSFDVSLLCVMG